MSVLGGPFYAQMAATSAVTDLITAFRGQPAIFTSRTTPPGFDAKAQERPWVITDGDAENEPLDLGDTAYIVTREVMLYDNNDGQPSAIDAAAVAVRDCFRDVDTLTVPDHQCRILEVTGPISDDPVNEEVFGRTVTVRVLLEEE